MQAYVLDETVLMTNGTGASNPFRVPMAGRYEIIVQGDLDGGTWWIERTVDNGATWHPYDGFELAEVGGFTNMEIGPATIRINQTGGGTPSISAYISGGSRG